VQAQVRREQARFARHDMMLPAVDAPAGLRARVLAAVREAMERDDALTLQPTILPSSGVNRWWRAASIGAMAATLVFGFTTMQLQRENREIAAQVAKNKISDKLLHEFGVRFESQFFNESTRFVTFDHASNFNGRAVLMYNPEKKSAQILLKDLPANVGEYELVIQDESGTQTRTLLTIRPSGLGPGIQTHDIPSLSPDAGAKLLLQAPNAQGETEPVLTATNSL
jgi:hypothetical protein